jgi:AcrR family transcriptional regulator
MRTVLLTVHRLLETEGLGSVTFGRVSREAGVSRSTLYRHWSSPSMLISDAWSQVSPPNHVSYTPELHDDLVRLFQDVRDVVEADAMRQSLPTLLVAAQRDPVLAALHTDFVVERRRPIVERLRTAREAGEIVAEADIEQLVDLLSGPIFYRQLLRREHTSDEEVRALVTTVLRSVTVLAPAESAPKVR